MNFTTPTQADDYERAVIVAAIASKEVRDILGYLSASDFGNPIYAKLWDAIQDLHMRGDAVDLLTVAERLDRWGALAEVGGIETLQKLVNETYSNPASIQTYARRVFQAGLTRRVLAVAASLGELANRGTEMDEQELRAEYNQLVQDAFPPMTTLLIQRADTLTAEFLHMLENPRTQGAIRIKSANLAKAGGSIAVAYPGLITTVISPSGGGKTMWLSQVAENAAIDGFHTVIVDGEIPPHLATARRLQRYSGVAADRQVQQTYTDKAILSADDWAALYAANERINGWLPRLQYLYTPNLGGGSASIWAAFDQIRELHRSTPISLIVMDYIQLWGDTEGKSAGTEAQQLARVMQGFKNLCGAIGAHGYVGSQVNNAAIRSGRIGQYDAKGAGAIPNKSNGVVILNRQRNTGASTMIQKLPSGRVMYIKPGDLSYVADVRIGKNSFGMSGMTTEFIMDVDRYKWEDYTERVA